jgi:molybdate transport system regulatory protein
MGMSYRRAWTLVQSINAAAGEPLVVAASGGAQGGGARLTPLGLWAISVFGQLQGQLCDTAAAMLSQLCERPSSARVHVAAAGAGAPAAGFFVDGPRPGRYARG